MLLLVMWLVYHTSRTEITHLVCLDMTTRSKTSDPEIHQRSRDRRHVSRPRMCPRYCYGTHSSTYILKVYHAEGKTQ